ncbi:hypothetical protein BLNAU_742 [Blattamonas nauphoetae]|uniref:Bromo domain-containing protein n=1 Tax=Blattamonas nauphoetae TaxID=2049346 RepID=A0ABQ9YKC7_9EUKA|nr:hypothetical protein BLNAU_742 [Blattamonas nauphoetae]
MSSTAILNNIHRVWDNCYLYNGVDSPISSHARDLQRTFAEKLERMVERGFWDADVVESARTSTEFDIIRAKKGKKPRWFIQQRKQKSAATKESTDVKEEVFIIHTRKREPTSSLKPRPALTLVALPPTPILPSPSKITPATFTIPRRTRSERKVEPKSFFDDSELPETEKRTRREPLPPLPPPEPAIHFSPSDILTEEHPEDTTPLTSKEKEQLVDGMSSLTPVQRAPLVAFLHPYLPQASQEDLSSPPLLDIETLDAPIQHRLFRYVYHFLK